MLLCTIVMLGLLSRFLGLLGKQGARVAKHLQHSLEMPSFLQSHQFHFQLGAFGIFLGVRSVVVVEVEEGRKSHALVKSLENESDCSSWILRDTIL
jgi:hypothetical protein